MPWIAEDRRKATFERREEPYLTEAMKKHLADVFLPRYPTKQAVTLPALHLVQDELRCVPLEAIREIAELLDLSPAEVHDTMSFYGIFRGESNKLGKTRLTTATIERHRFEFELAAWPPTGESVRQPPWIYS